MKLILSVLLTLTVFVNTGAALVSFSAARHVNTAFSNAILDTVLEDVTQRFNIDNNRCNDVACEAYFVRNGDVNTFGTMGDGLNVIDTQAELDTVFAVAEHAKVVDAVDFCGGTLNPSWIGCGRCGTQTFVLETWVSGATYVHEFGHNIEIYDCAINSGHRTDCSGNIMNSAPNGSDSVNAYECTMFSGIVYTELCGDVYNGNGGPLNQVGGPYWLTCTVTVPAGQTLTIQGGVRIQFKSNNKITVNGTLNADGNPTIHLYSNSTDFPGIEIGEQMKLMSGGEIMLH